MVKENRDEFRLLERALSENEGVINRELMEAQGSPVDLGGYYFPDIGLADKAMRPSSTFNRAIASLQS